MRGVRGLSEKALKSRSSKKKKKKGKKDIVLHFRPKVRRMLEKVERVSRKERYQGAARLCLEQKSKGIAKIVGYKDFAGSRL